MSGRVASELLRPLGGGGDDDDSVDEEEAHPCRFATAFAVPKRLEELRPPYVVLDGLGSAMNVGQLLRSARCLGIVSFVMSSAAWSAVNGRAAAVSGGWLYHADFHYASDIGAALQQLHSRGVRLYAAEEFFPEAVTPHSSADAPGQQWALVIGSEDKGLSPAALQLCEYKISIPQRRGASLNVATAATLCLYELSRDLHL